MPATSISWRRAPAAVAATAVLLGSLLSSCGGGGPSASTGARHAAPSAARVDGYVDRDGYVHGDRDEDAPGPTRSDSDDSYVRAYGVAADAAQLRAVAPLVKRYYAAAAAGDASRACSLLAPAIARGSSFSAYVPLAFSSVAGSSLFRHRTCEQVESLMFELGREHLVAGAPTVKLAALRVRGRRGIALLAFRTLPERELAVERSAGRWTVATLLDEEII